jgi:Zn-dependent protease with chaperone function
MFVFLWFAVVLYFVARKPDGGHRWDLVIECIIWPFVAVALCNILSLRPRKKEFQQADKQSRVMSTNYPELYKALQGFARLCGMKRPPEMYVLPTSRAFMFTIPAKGGTIVASSRLLEELKPEEVQALVAHEMGHILAKHVRTELAIIYIRAANPVWKFILLPVTLMEWLMRGWLDAIDYSADRCAVLLTGGTPKLVNAAIVKGALAATSEPEISMQELDEFLTAPGNVETDQALLERQIRARQFIDHVPNLRDRIEALGEFLKTDQAQQAMEKLTQLSKTGGAAAT